MSISVNFTELLCYYEDILREIIQLLGANCWRLALVNTKFLAAIKAILPKLNLRITGMCCYYKSPAIMFGILEKVSEKVSNLYAINCYMKKTFVCSVETSEDRGYMNINNRVVSFPCINGTKDNKSFKYYFALENRNESDTMTAKDLICPLQQKNLTVKGYFNTIRIFNCFPDYVEKTQKVLKDLEFCGKFPDFLGEKVKVYNYFVNGEKLIYDTSIGAIVKYYYEIKEDQFPIPTL